jgi:hypothetical protein
MTQLAPAPVPPQNMASTAALLSEWPRIKFQPAGDRNKFWTVWFEQAANSINSCPVPFPDQKQELARVAWGGAHFRINGRGGIKLSFTAGLIPLRLWGQHFYLHFSFCCAGTCSDHLLCDAQSTYPTTLYDVGVPGQ